MYCTYFFTHYASVLALVLTLVSGLARAGFGSDKKKKNERKSPDQETREEMISRARDKIRPDDLITAQFELLVLGGAGIRAKKSYPEPVSPVFRPLRRIDDGEGGTFPSRCDWLNWASVPRDWELCLQLWRHLRSDRGGGKDTWTHIAKSNNRVQEGGQDERKPRVRDVHVCGSTAIDVWARTSYFVSMLAASCMGCHACRSLEGGGAQEDQTGLDWVSAEKARLASARPGSSKTVEVLITSWQAV